MCGVVCGAKKGFAGRWAKFVLGIFRREGGSPRRLRTLFALSLSLPLLIHSPPRHTSLAQWSLSLSGSLSLSFPPPLLC